MEYLESPKPEHKAKFEIWCKDSTRKKFNVIRSELDLTQGDCLEHLVNLYEEHTERYAVAGIRR
jgi:hypothetical protein